MRKSLVISVCAILIAISVVLSYLTISVSSNFQISFADIPILFSGILFGPIWGAITGFAKDLFSIMTKGNTLNLFTLGKVIEGLIPGIALLIFGSNRLYKNAVLLFVVAFITLNLRTVINSTAMIVHFNSSFSAEKAVFLPKLGVNTFDSVVFVIVALAVLPKIKKIIFKK